MHSARIAALGAVDGEEVPYFVENATKRSGFITTSGFDGVAVHRIARPDHRPPFALHCLDQGWQRRFDAICAHAGDQSQAARLVIGVEGID